MNHNNALITKMLFKTYYYIYIYILKTDIFWNKCWGFHIYTLEKRIFYKNKSGGFHHFIYILSSFILGFHFFNLISSDKITNRSVPLFLLTPDNQMLLGHLKCQS